VSLATEPVKTIRYAANEASQIKQSQRKIFFHKKPPIHDNKTQLLQIPPTFMTYRQRIERDIQKRSAYIGECCEFKKDGKVLVRSCRLVD
jgi:hypothetical protein